MDLQRHRFSRKPLYLRIVEKLRWFLNSFFDFMIALYFIMIMKSKYNVQQQQNYRRQYKSYGKKSRIVHRYTHLFPTCTCKKHTLDYQIEIQKKIKEEET